MSENQYLEEIDFDQNERITDRLRDLVRNYPKGLGLIKEFLQNADDAGASTLKVIYDRRRHDGSFEDKAMEVALGPALLFVNDQTFTDDDFEHIQRIGDSGKLRDSKRTGRFGLGFNTSYSVSDNPSLLTRDKIAWFDPHRRIEQVKSKGKNAIAWKVPGVVKQWPDWIKTFYAAGLRSGDESFIGTVFRLPLRSDIDAELSEISQDPFTKEDFDAILEELQHVGPPLLLFLRSVTTLEIREIYPDGTDHLRYWLSTINQSEVDRHRSFLREIVKGNPEELLEKWLESDEPLPVKQYDHSFILKGIDEVEREETWAVTSGLFRGPDNCLLEDALKVCKHREKALPWAGAATLKSGIRPEKIFGGLACFLPLPEPADWPVWLHGWFDLSSNRHGITRSAEVGENTHDRYEWNKSLMEFAVAEAWVRLMEQVAGDAEKNKTPYNLWPHYPFAPNGVDESLLIGFYRLAATKPIIRGLDAEGFHWYSLNDGVDDLPRKWHDRLAEPFLAEGWAICVPPLDTFVKKGFEKAGQELPTLTSEIVRDYLITDESDPDIACPLTDAPNPMLTKREWIYSLTEFCAEGDLDNLKFLPLALLDDGLLHTFTVCGTLFIIDDDKRILLKSFPERLFDVEYQAASGITEAARDIKVINFELGSFVEYVPEILEKGEPDPTWLCAFFDYLEKHGLEAIEVYADDLKELKVVPDQNNCWHEMGKYTTPLIQKNENDLLYKALTRLNVPLLLDGPKELVLAIEKFASKHDGFIWYLTAYEFGRYLNFHIESGKESILNESAFDERAVLEPVLDFLASETDGWLDQDDENLLLIQKARFLPTTSGQRVAAKDPDIYIPGEFKPPAGFEGKYQLLDTGEGHRWRQLFLCLDVKTLDGGNFVESALLPAFSTATREQCYHFLVWLRDEFQFVERELNEQRREELRQKIRYVPILLIKDGGLAAFSEVYHPNAEDPAKIFGDRARIPDMKFFTADKDLWMKFFHEFRLLSKPLAKDLIKEIQILVGVSFEHGASAVRVPLRNLIDYIREHWVDVANIKYDGRTTFAGTLSQLSWLPAISDQSTNYAACGTWPDSLWQADQLVPSRLANLVASKYPVLDTKQEFPEGMSKALGLITRVALPDVLDHFTNVRASLSAQTTESELEMIRRSAHEVYRFIGQMNSDEKKQWRMQLNSLSKEACVLTKNKWWNPSRCFFSQLPFATSWAVSLADLYPNSDPFLRQGLEQLGVRQAPDFYDWLKMLWDLADAPDNGILDSDALNQARHIMRLLRSAPNECLKEESIFVPLSTGKLGEARLSLIPDDLRLKKMDCMKPIPLIEDNEDSIDVGRRAGARSLRGCLVDRLKENPVTATNQTFAKKLQARVRSNDFEQCLRRIAYEEALRQNDSDPLELANDTHLDQAHALEICIASKIEVESVVDIEGEDVVVFEINDAPCFLDKDVPRLWLKERSDRKMRDEVVRALGELCELNEQLWLDRVLEKEPEEMSKVLDEGDVAELPAGRKWDLDNGFNISREAFNDDSEAMESASDNEDEQADEDLNEWSADIEEIEYSESIATEGQVEDQSRGAHRNSQREEENMPTRDASHNSFGGNSRNNRNRNTDSFGQKNSTPKSTPTMAGHSSSNPWTGESQNDSSKISQVRLRSYVHEREQSDYDTETSESEAKGIGDAGETIVINWEFQSGRVPRRMPQNNEGYDIESVGDDGIRYIEVKSINGPWGLRGVGVTRAQYNKARELGQSWWLYVVEYAKDDANAVVNPIQNPFVDLITEYRFDDGWRAVCNDQTD